jgi:hypothetical protein
MGVPTDPLAILSGLAVLSVAYAVVGLVLLAHGRYRSTPRRATAGGYLAVASPLPVVLFGLLVALVAVSPPPVRLALWLVVLLGAWAPILLSPAIVVVFRLYR